MTRTRRRRAALMAPLLTVTLALLASCGGSDDKSTGASDPSTTEASSAPSGSDTKADDGGGEPQSGEVAATIKGFKFSPDALTVKVGANVTWTNEDSSTHTVTAEDGSFDLTKLTKGKTGSFTFSEAGTFDYKCDIHPTMKAAVTVE